MLTVWTKKTLKFLGSTRRSDDHGISPFFIICCESMYISRGPVVNSSIRLRANSPFRLLINPCFNINSPSAKVCHTIDFCCSSRRRFFSLSLMSSIPVGDDDKINVKKNLSSSFTVHFQITYFLVRSVLEYECFDMISIPTYQFPYQSVCSIAFRQIRA